MSSAAGRPSSPRGPADVVITGATVVTSNPLSPRAEAVAVRDGRIVEVGRDGDVAGWIGPGTRVLELRGRTVVPGFQDAHIHPIGGGLDRMQCDLHDVGTAGGYVEAVRTYAASHPEAPWILGGGWALDQFPGGRPHRALLDAVVPDRPVYLPNRDGHGAWVNTRAMEAAGISRDTPDPVDGRIERDEDGEPFGVLHEGAMHLVERLVPPSTGGDLRAALLDAQTYLHSLGITAWQDAHVEEPDAQAYRSLVADGMLTARVVGALWWDRERGEEQVEELVELRAAATDGRFRATSVKVMQDGIVENFTSGMIEPYLDRDGRATSNRGLSFVEPELLKRVVARLEREGFQVHVHAIGDRAVREALDAFEFARAARGSDPDGPGPVLDLRHHIAHIQVVHPDDVPRFAALGVAPNAQPLWACVDGQMRDLTIPFLGAERTTHQYPFASLVKSGAMMAMGSDWPVSTPDVLAEMATAVTRAPHDASGADPFLPEERLSLEQALHAFTMGSAFVNHLDDRTGSIEAGKAADMAVVDRALFDIDPHEIGRARVLLTLVDGEPVHLDPSIGW